MPPPPRPKMPLDSDMWLYTYTTYVKGVLGLGRGGKGVVQAKDNIAYLIKIDHFAEGRFYCTSTV